MTESDWWACQEPRLMLEFLRDTGKLSERKARLLAVAACRRIWHLMRYESSRRAIEVVEQYSEGLCCEEKLRAVAARAYDLAMHLDAHSNVPASSEAEYHAAFAAWQAATAGPPHPMRTLGQAARAIAWEDAGDDYGPKAGIAAEHAECACQCILLRDIFCDPFQAKPTIPAGVLAWNAGCVVKLATSIYQERDFSQERMDVLADALEEAGVTAEEVLGHCRGLPGVHVRGCWLVDFLMGRE
jgi:hypothetical protein